MTTNFGHGNGQAFTLALQPDGKILVGGGASTAIGTRVELTLARYLANGTLDVTFNGKGWVATDFGRSGSAKSIALQADGKIIVAGDSEDATGSFSDIVLARYFPNGTLDTTFSGDGTLRNDFNAYDFASALALQPDGKIVVAGTSQNIAFSGGFVVARYLPNGTLDTTFSGDGWITTNFGESSHRGFAGALAIQRHDGRLVVAGESVIGGRFNTTSDFALARYHAITCNGVVVTRIGTAGNDTIIGTSGNDVIFGFGGNDFIDGRGGNDILCGGSGNDTLVGGTGDDTLIGSPGTDICRGDSHVVGDQASQCETVTGVP